MLWTLLLTSLIAHQMLMIADSKEPSTNADGTTPRFTNKRDDCGGEQVDLKNLVTHQSSNYVDKSITFSSEKAIDGKESTCAHSKQEGPHFWTIDLQNVFNISCVCIYNEDSPNTDITGAEIIIGKRSITIPNSFKLKQQNCLHLPKGELARNIIVNKNTDEIYPSDYLILCDVTIWNWGQDGTTPYWFTRDPQGRPKLPNDCGEEILVDLQNLFTNQSSNYVDKNNITYSSERAIDGNRSTCAHSEKEGRQDWTIDLQNVFNISCVCIYNDGAYNTDMTNAEIIIGNQVIIIDSFKVKQQNCLHLPKGELARNITVTRQCQYLVLCEVTIWGQASPFVLITQKKTWEHALYYCREHDMDLASILDEQDQAWAEAAVREADTPGVWLGLRYTCTLGFWFWIQSLDLEYSNFADRTNAQSEECDMSVAMNKTDGKWYTVADNMTYNFICTKR